MSVSAFLFPGQGSQFVGMGNKLFNESKAAKEIFEAADEALGIGISTICFEGPEEALVQTVNTQPGLLTVEIATYEAWKELKGREVPAPSFTAGHSLGEYSALVAAGALKLADALKVIRVRGLLMGQAGEQNPGGMLAVIGLAREPLEEVCNASGTYIANDNCPGQIVISGGNAELEKAAALAKESGAKMCVPLKVSGAFHSPLMNSACQGLAEAVDDVEIKDAEIPVIGNSTGRPIIKADDIRAELKAQIISPVHWTDTMTYLIGQGVKDFYEIGPGNVLAGLLKRTSKEVKCAAINEETIL